MYMYIETSPCIFIDLVGRDVAHQDSNRWTNKIIHWRLRLTKRSVGKIMAQDRSEWSKKSRSEEEENDICFW